MESPGFEPTILGYLVQLIMKDNACDNILTKKQILHKTWVDAMSEASDLAFFVEDHNCTYPDVIHESDSIAEIKCNTERYCKIIDMKYDSNDEVIASIYVMTVYNK